MGSKKGTYNACRCCGAPVKKPYWNHISCKQKADAEFKASIEAIPESPVTLEIWCRMWGMGLDEGRESYENWLIGHHA